MLLRLATTGLPSPPSSKAGLAGSTEELVLSEGEIEQELLDLIAARLGTVGEKVHTGGLEQLQWATAGKATVLVYLPVVGIPPITVGVVEAGGGVVLRGWPNTWSDEEKIREHKPCVSTRLGRASRSRLSLL